MLTGGVLLGIMVVPFAAAIIREGYAGIPKEIREAIYSLGVTRWEAIAISLRHIKNYVAGGLLLALGRAMGETIAVAMVVGGVPRMFRALTEPGTTISVLIVNQFANSQLYNYMESALFGAALVLAVVGMALNLIALNLVFRR